MALEPITPESLDRAAAALRGGAVVAFPTETVYGLGAHAFDPHAVARIFDIKARPSFDPLIVHVRDAAMLATVAASVSPLAQRLIDAFWPGPLTLVFAKTAAVPDIVTSGLPTVAVRMPAHPVAQALLERAGIPLAAPSANPFGRLSPTRAVHVDRLLGDRVDTILDGGATQHGIESTIVLLEPQPTLLRSGAIAIDAIEAIVGPVARTFSDETAPLAPGRLPQHYAPSRTVRIVDDASAVPLHERSGAGLLAYRRSVPGYAHTRVLSPEGDLREAATRLFESLHDLDETRVTRIDAERVPEHGIGAAIMDRLVRAAK